MSDDILTLWVIYRHPLDYSDKFVVRAQHVRPRAGVEIDVEPTAVVDSLEEAREEIPAGLFNLGRQHDDDPAIYEVWL